MLKISLLAASLLFALVTPSFGQSKRGPSTPEERTKALASIDDLEANPLGPNAKEERRWLTIWLIEVPDIHVTFCTDLLPDEPKKDKLDSNAIWTQMMFSSARYAIQHDGGSGDSPAQQLAGVEGALKVYEAILAQKPEDREAGLDAMLKRRADGTLGDWVKEQAAKHCKGH